MSTHFNQKKSKAARSGRLAWSCRSRLVALFAAVVGLGRLCRARPLWHRWPCRRSDVLPLGHGLDLLNEPVNDLPVILNDLPLAAYLDAARLSVKSVLNVAQYLSVMLWQAPIFDAHVDGEPRAQGWHLDRRRAWFWLVGWFAYCHTIAPLRDTIGRRT